MLVMTIDRAGYGQSVNGLGWLGMGMSKDDALRAFQDAEVIRLKLEAIQQKYAAYASAAGDTSGMMKAFSDNWKKVQGFTKYGPTQFGAWAKGATESGEWFRQQAKKILDAARKGGAVVTESDDLDVGTGNINNPRSPDNAFPEWGNVALVAAVLVIGYMGYRAYKRRDSF